MAVNRASSPLLLVLFCTLTLRATLSTQNTTLSPGPVVYVLNGSNLTFMCTPISPWNVIIFKDNGIIVGGVAVVEFRRQGKTCTNTDILNGYLALPCDLGKPVGMTILTVPGSYHNKTITCQVNLGTTPVGTIVKIRDMLTIPMLETKNNLTQREGLFFEFKCTAHSIPNARIEWYLGGSKVSSNVIISNPTESTNISKINFEARKDNNDAELYCSANDSFTTLQSSSVTLNVLYVPSIYIEPQHDLYMVYEGQKDVILTCTVRDANPLNIIQYRWINHGGIVENENVSIAVISKDVGGLYSCNASNIAGTSKYATRQMDVQYGPIIAVLPEKNITAGTSLSVNAFVDANPNSSKVWWTRLNDANFTHDGVTLNILNIQKNYTDTYTCHARNTLTPSGLLMKNKTDQKTVYVNVQYVPTTNMTPSYNPYVLYFGQHNVSLTCIVEDANPLNGITYHWTTPAGNAEGKTYRIETVSTTTSGQYHCAARNAIGKSSVYTKAIDVQYGPLILNISHQEDIVEGKNLTIYPAVDSNPTARLVWWTRRNDSHFKYDSAVLIIDRIHRNVSDHYTFHVINTLTPSDINPRNMTSEWILFVNVQYPPSSIIADVPNREILENTTVTLHCSAKNANPSTTSISWYQNESLILSNKANYTISNIKRKAAGSYICNAGNKVGNGTSSVNITVLYGPDIKNLLVINGSTVRNNSTVVFECEIDSMPASRISWTFNNELMSDYNYNERHRYYNIKETTCYHTGSYRCSATNTINEQVYNASKDVMLYVTCSPRLDIYMEQPEVKIGLPLGGILNLTVHIVAFPELTEKGWTFRPNSSSNISYNQEGIFISKVFRHFASLYKPNLTETDFGDYTLEVHNSYGSNIYNFHVVPEGPPEPSLIINATCGIRTALVFWVTSFSGGDTQQFSVIIDNGNRKDTIETNILSNAKGEMKNILLHLSPGEYTFTILGENQYDSTLSLNMDSCHVKDASNTGTNHEVAAAAGGGIGTAIIILGAVVFIIYIIKRRRMIKGKEQENGRKKLTDEDHENDGLKDNPLYGTSGACNDESGPTYSHVKKSFKIEEHHKDDEDIGAVYSQVQKKTSRGKIVKDDKGKKKEKQFGKNQKDIEMGSVYENSEKVIKDKKADEIYANSGTETETEQLSDKCGYQRNKNKDGLIYADLDLVPNGKRFVIRGIENRNNYAIIDLTKTAEPLPSDEEDDEDPNGPGNTTTNLE